MELHSPSLMKLGSYFFANPKGLDGPIGLVADGDTIHIDAG